MNRFIFILLILSALISTPLSISASEKTKSLVFKDQTWKNDPIFVRRYDPASELFDAFMVVKKANSGDPVAQHELGLRYITGEGFIADTVKAAYWIRKAAEQNLIPARYNYGILLNNGWGVDWNPFEAYKDFKYAAQHDIIEAKYIYGLLLTEDLVVSRNYPEAYRWIKMAADSGYSPAKDILQEFEKWGIDVNGISMQSNSDDTSRKNNSIPSQLSGGPTLPNSVSPVYLDFSTDSVPEIDNQTLMEDLFSEGSTQLRQVGSDIKSGDSTLKLDSIKMRYIFEAAEAGSPEALTLIARWYEQGVHSQRDLIQSTIYYLRAICSDAPWAPELLWKMIKNSEYYQLLKTGVDNDIPAAQYAWAGLFTIGFDRQLVGAQALELLQKAASRNYTDALMELGRCYYTGCLIKQDKEKATELFRLAANKGNREATVRLCMIELENPSHSLPDSSLMRILRDAVQRGSVLAQAMLGYCYDKGICVPSDRSLSVSYYRQAAHRGSKIARENLRNLYDKLRPNDPEFQIHE